jgi:hypothetical protein
LQRLTELIPEELEKEIAEAGREGYQLICVPGLRIRIRDYSLKPDDEE